MNRRKIKNYTIWIACTGKNPIVLSLRPLVICLAIVLPVSLIGAVLFSFVQKNNQLAQRNSKLTEEASSILDRVEALESTLTNLQERANISESEEDSELDSDLSELDANSDSSADFATEEEVDSSLDDAVGTEEDDEAVEESEALDYSHSLEPSRGMGGAIGAEGLLAAARSKLPNLIKELEGEVEPALQAIIVREEAKPIGTPLTAKNTEVTSGFGFRPNPFGWGYEFHQGIDFVADYGSPVYATAAGTVSKAEWEPGYGNHVIVDHGYGLETLYAHLSEIKVENGARLDRHDILGYLGNTGRSSGPHLHYSVFRDGQPVDPKKYLD